MATEEVKKLAANAARNTDDRPLLEFHAPRQLFEDTRDLNVELLYQHKQGLIPPGADIPDPETTYEAMIEPLLNIKRSGLANQAMAMLSQLERRDPASLHIAIARLNLDSGNLAFAEDALKKASESQKPDSGSFAETEELWGLVLEAEGNRDEAIEHFKNAALADPTRAVSLKKLADIYSQNKNWNDAAGWMEKYLETNPRAIGESWALLGDYRMAASQSEPAMQALETSLRLDPYTYWARWRLARMFEDRKEVDSAIEQYEFLVKYAFDRDPEIYQRLVALYRDAGRLNDARRVLRKARRMLSTNPDIYRLYQDVVD
jgi:tetratricopeptide (TPR) repeat protein